jgi:hypothetical protein
MQMTHQPKTTSTHLDTPAMTPDVNTDPRQLRRIDRAIGAKSFAVLSTVSEAGFPHAAGVVYSKVGAALYVHTMRTSRKARNVGLSSRVGVVVPIRKIPVGPPFSIQFQASARVLPMDDPEITALLDRGELKNISGHGALEEPDGCFLRIEPTAVIHTYGIGVSALALARDPLHVGADSVHIDDLRRVAS